MSDVAVSNLRERLARFPKVPLIHAPTPFRPLERLSGEVGGPRIWVKRDDLTGLAFGGNKSRKLEYILADALRKGADTVVTWGSLQSNWCLQTAAAARRLGMDAILVLFRAPGTPDAPDGNLLLDRIVEAAIRVREAPPGKVVNAALAMPLLEEAGREARARGRRPYLVPVGGSKVLGDMDRPLGAMAYVEACAETLEQARAAGFEPRAIVHATGSGSTQAGLIVGAKALTGGRCRVVGISVSDPKGPFGEDVLEIARAADDALGTGLGIGPGDVEVFDEFMGGGYAVVDRDVAETIRLVFRTEGIVLDPVYTAKAMAGLIGLSRRGELRAGDDVVFMHTGGTPALFPNRDAILRNLS